MSASLVGSEMCIRDRINTPPRSSPLERKLVVAASNSKGPGPKAQPRLSAVSYTHLTLPTICSV
eukprot:2129425-Alexandrium_andersonii.AAC.1